MTALLSAIAITAATPGLADEIRTITVVNATATSVNQIFVRQAGRADRSGVAGALGDLVAPRGDRDDRLGSRSLSPRATIALPLTGIAGCRVDLKAILEDGRTFTATDHDACASPRWTIGR